MWIIKIGLLLGKTEKQIRREFTSQDLIDYIAYIQLTNEMARDPLAALPEKEQKKKRKQKTIANLTTLFGPGKKVKKGKR